MSSHGIIKDKEQVAEYLKCNKCGRVFWKWRRGDFFDLSLTKFIQDGGRVIEHSENIK